MKRLKRYIKWMVTGKLDPLPTKGQIQFMKKLNITADTKEKASKRIDQELKRKAEEVRFHEQKKKYKDLVKRWVKTFNKNIPATEQQQELMEKLEITAGSKEEANERINAELTKQFDQVIISGQEKRYEELRKRQMRSNREKGKEFDMN